MKLGDWLTRKGMSPTEFGRRIDRPQATISRYASGKRIPEPEIMRRIVDETGGEVTPNDFYDVAVSPCGGGAS